MSAVSHKKKRLGCLTVSIFLLTVLLLYNFNSIKREKENKHRAYIALTLRDNIEKHYRDHQIYPKDIYTFITQFQQDIKYPEVIKDFIENGVLNYSTDPTAKRWFWLTCRYSGVLQLNSQYNFSWSGIQYSNDMKKLPLQLGSGALVDKNGFYPADFH